MKSRVETSHLGQVGKSVMKRLDQQNLLGHMLRIERTEAAADPRPFPRVIRCGSLYFGPPCTTRCPTAVNASRAAEFLDPIHQNIHRCRVIRRRHRREKLSAWFKPLTANVAPGSPIRSIPPSRIRRSELASLKQCEFDARRAAIDRQDPRVSWLHGRHLSLMQSERSQFRACGLDSPCEECFESPNLLRSGRTLGCYRYRRICSAGAWAMSSASRKMSASGLRTWTKQEEMKESTNPSQLELSDPIRIQFACFIADHDDLKPVPDLEVGDQFDHLRVRFRLRKHKAPKLSAGERPFLEKDHPA